MFEKIAHYVKNRAFLIGFLPIFGLEGLIIYPLPPAFYLEEKPSLEWVVTPLTYADVTQNNAENDSPVIPFLAVMQDSALIASGASTPVPRSKKIKVVMTAYSSHPDETDDTPFTTASGTKTRDGIVAANFLPFGTAVKIPELFGDKVFVVEDRMHRRFSKRMDIWMPSKKDAIIFGKVSAEIEILN